jgi:hypothetical protein
VIGDDTRALHDISVEALRASVQHEGTDDLPDGTRNGGAWLVLREQAKNACDRAQREGRLTFAHILEEEFYEALCEEDKTALRKELVQLGATVVRWLARIDRDVKP